ncbi:YfbU family protein [Pantoea piersonii]|uniref:YfbU family protein n=1 Tax=Pantoea piersonii TaxID=2364647 RepID=UPI00289683ED|nr:YfbU family protein [Pantoea piersonii]
MKYTQQEKLQILMLCDVYRALGIKHSYDPDIIEEAITSENYWAIDWEYQHLSSGVNNPREVKFFVDTYDMYGILGDTYKKLSPEDKADVGSKVRFFSEENSLEFPGFDGNNEGEFMSIGRMLQKMGRFSGSDELTKNSHIEKVNSYRRMLEVFLPARRDEWNHIRGISKESLIATLNAEFPPE